MRRDYRIHTLLGGAAVGVFVAGAGGAAYGSKEHEEHAAKAVEVSAVLAARIPPVDAIRAAAARSLGRRAVEFALRDRDHSFGYEVEVISGSSRTKIVVDSSSGVAMPSFETTEAPNATQVQAIAGELAAAVAAERQAGGRALEANAGTTNGQPVFEVSVAKTATDMQRVTVASKDGQVLGMVEVGAGAEGLESESDVD